LAFFFRVHEEGFDALVAVAADLDVVPKKNLLTSSWVLLMEMDGWPWWAITDY